MCWLWCFYCRAAPQAGASELEVISQQVEEDSQCVAPVQLVSFTYRDLPLAALDISLAGSQLISNPDEEDNRDGYVQKFSHPFPYFAWQFNHSVNKQINKYIHIYIHTYIYLYIRNCFNIIATWSCRKKAPYIRNVKFTLCILKISHFEDAENKLVVWLSVKVFCN